jgi:hypothetical protein
MMTLKNVCLVSSLLALTTFEVFAQSSLRLDTGLYTGTDLPASKEGNNNKSIPGNANVTHKYVRFGYNTTLPKEINLSTYAEYLEVQMNNFSQETAKDGDTQKGVAEAGFELSRGIYQYSDWYNLGLGIGMSAPGYGYNANTFNAPGQGFTAYILSIDNYFTVGDFGFGANIMYKERPGSNGNEEAPEQIIYDLSASYFHESHFISVSRVSLRAQSGVDLSGQYFTRFPVVKESSDTYVLTYGYLFADGNQIDLNVSQKNAIDNTDGGLGYNLGYSYHF